jgi:hypothetical protein
MREIAHGKLVSDQGFMLEIRISRFARNWVELGIFVLIRGSLLRGSGVMSLAQHAHLPCASQIIVPVMI